MNFFITSFIECYEWVGFQSNFNSLNIILPVGISFYTFQVSSYVIDVYRKEIEASKSLLNFSVFIAFFPQLVAGPIERAKQLLPQFEKTKKFNVEDFTSGSFLMLSGFFKKIVIADNLAVFSDHVFELPNNAQGIVILIGFLAFTLQIYCDFSGYTDIARGSAKILGFNLMENFRSPYLSRSPREFWSRWHISLSTWLRDYLYISLGGNRVSQLITYRNLMVTMLLGGLWHGANWTFVIWGGFHGILLIIYRLLGVEKIVQRIPKYNPLSCVLWIVWMFLTTLCWGIFRAESFSDYIEMLIRLGSNQSIEWPSSFFYFATYFFMLTVFEIILHQKRFISEKLQNLFVLRAVFYMVVFYLIVVYGAYRGNEFIYFQF